MAVPRESEPCRGGPSGLAVEQVEQLPVGRCFFELLKRCVMFPVQNILDLRVESIRFAFEFTRLCRAFRASSFRFKRDTPARTPTMVRFRSKSFNCALIQREIELFEERHVQFASKPFPVRHDPDEERGKA